MAKPKSTDGCGTLLILFALIYAFVQFIEKNHIIICIIAGILILSIFVYRFLKHKKKLKASQLHQVRNLQKLDGSKKYPSASQIDSANSLLEKAHHLADILNTTTNRKEFYASFYELSVVLKSLSEFEGLINFENSLPSTDLNKLKENRQASIDFLEKRIKDAESQATNGQNNVSELVDETKPQSSNDQNDISKPPQPNVDVEKSTTQHILTQQIEKLRKQIEETESQTINDQNDISEPMPPDMSEADIYFEEAGKLVTTKGRASIGMLQRMFKIGFNRAERIMDQLCEVGIISPVNGSNPRTVLMSETEFLKVLEKWKQNTSHVQSTIYSKNIQEQSSIERIKWYNNKFDYMTGNDFEQFCSLVLQENGYATHVTPASGDFGVDIIAEQSGITYAIQCKCYSSDIGVDAVYQVAGGMKYYHANLGIVLTNRYFTRQAQELASGIGIILWNRDSLIKLIHTAGLNNSSKLANAEEVAPQPDELAAISAYKAGDPDYQPSISQEEVLKELGLN